MLPTQETHEELWSSVVDVLSRFPLTISHLGNPCASYSLACLNPVLREDEEIRIKELGGRVIFWGRWRVEGVLAVSRAIGDVNLKPYVTCDPEITNHVLTPEDQFLILASDGLWDVMSNEEVGSFISRSHAILLPPPTFSPLLNCSLLSPEYLKEMNFSILREIFVMRRSCWGPLITSPSWSST